MRRKGWFRNSEKREHNEKRNRLYENIRVTGGLGSYLGKKSRIFFINLNRPLERNEVRIRLMDKFGARGMKIHVSTPITFESVSFAIRTPRPIEVKEAWNITVQALGDLFDGNTR